MASFEVLDGFEISLVACEPLVVDPIAFAYDARERLFVVEMRGYSEQDSEHLGRVALLKDTDGDGRMDQRTTYVSGLSWPTAIWPWRDGVLVTHPPHLTWFRDTDGDGISDTSQEWFVGFGRDNVQGMVNSLRWGVNGFIHGAVSSTGAELSTGQTQARRDVVSVEQQTPKGSQPIVLRRRDFTIDPLNRTLQPASGGGQHGLSFNRWGDKFVTSNSDHLQQIIDLDSWLAGHPSRVPLPALRRSIAEDGPQAEVFRVSPVEPWRIVRTRLRVTGIVPGIVEGGGRPAGYFTGATGTWIMDAEMGFGDSDKDTALVCDVGSNLVHRKRLIDHGLFWSGQRLDDGKELLRSRDIWFRPVQLGDAPDGSLIIADMYREVIEHPKSLPLVIKQHLDLTSGRDRGRIWRLRPVDSSRPSVVAGKADERPRTKLLSDLSAGELVQELQSSIAWRRRMASQLLVELGDSRSAAALVDLALTAAAPEARVLAMQVADRLGVLTVAHVESLLHDTHPRVVCAALGLVRRHGWGSQLTQSLKRLTHRPEPRLQLELAALSADLEPRVSLEFLRDMMPFVEESLVRSLLVIAAGERSRDLFAGPKAVEMPSDTLRNWLALLLPVWSEALSEDEALSVWLSSQLSGFHEPRHGAWLDALAGLSNRRQMELILGCLSETQRGELSDYVATTLRKRIDDQNAAWVLFVDGSRQEQWIERLLEPSQSQAVQRQALRAIEISGDPRLDRILFGALSTLTPSHQDQALRGLIKRSTSTAALLEAVETGQVQPSQIALDVRQQILASKDKSIASRAEQLLGQASADRLGVIEEYAAFYQHWQRDVRSSDRLEAIRASGAQHFERVCGQCHRVAGKGHDVGAALTQLADKSPRQLLEAVLDPNREVDPRYAGYTILLLDGRVVTGVIREETANQIGLATAGGEQLDINRSDIEEMKSTGVSLMPTGLEEQLTPRQLAEVLVFLQKEWRGSPNRELD